MPDPGLDPDPGNGIPVKQGRPLSSHIASLLRIPCHRTRNGCSLGAQPGVPAALVTALAPIRKPIRATPALALQRQFT